MRWIIRWEDTSGDCDHDVHKTADSVVELLEVVKLLLTDQTFTNEDTPEDSMGEDAFAVFHATLLDSAPLESQEVQLFFERRWEEIKFPCDDGELFVVRER